MYTAFAQVYDQLMDDFDYPKWAEYYLELISRAGIRPETLLDAGCGTGSMALEFARRSIAVTAADLSEEMLESAAEKFRKAGLTTRLICQDMCALLLPKPVDAVTCVCDGVNYLITPRRLRAFFQAAWRALKPGGALAFDFSSRHKLEEEIGDAFFGEEREEVAYLWENRLDRDKHLVAMDITFFLREGDGRYRRFRERHVQRAHTSQEILPLLKEAGFGEICVFGDRTFNSPSPEEKRIHILAKKG